MNNTSRRRVLETIGLVHPRPEAVTSPLFQAADPFFFALDKVQVKYEMLRAHFCEGDTVTAAAALTWLLPSRVLFGGRRVRRGGDDRPARRASGPQRTDEVDRRCASRSWMVSVRARRPRPPRSWRNSWGCVCIHGPSSGPGSDEPVLAAHRSRHNVTTNGCGRLWSGTGAAARRSGRGPFRSAGPGRTDHMAGWRGGLLGLEWWVRRGRLDALWRSAPRRCGRHLPASARGPAQPVPRRVLMASGG